MVRKGFEPDAVRAHLDRCADELRRGRADAEAARLESQRLRRELEDARAELATEPHTNEAIAILGDEANRIIHAAQESSKEIVAAAEAAAEDIRAKARDEAARIAEDSRRESEDFGGRLVGQADEVRAKLRDEIRRARLEFAEEADRLRADARYEADSIVEAAREEARALRADAEDAAAERQDQVAALAAERLASADAAAEARVAEAAASAEALLAEAEEARAQVLAELNTHRELLEAHVQALQGAHARARADLSSVQTLLSGLSAELEHVRLREVEIPPLSLDAAIPTVPAPADVSSEIEVDAAAEVEPAGDASGDASGAEAGAGAGAEAVAEDGDADTGVAAEPDSDEALVIAGESEAEADEDEWLAPGDAEIDALFERVVSQRDDAGTDVEAPAPAVRAVAEVVDEDDDWGFDDAAGYADAGSPHAVDATATAGTGSTADDSGETKQRVFAALHQLAVDTGEVAIATPAAAAGANGTADTNGNGTGAEMAASPAAADDSDGGDDSGALDLVPALTRKVKRALQEVENAARDADPEAGVVDVVGVFVDYLGPQAAEAMALGAGGSHAGDIGDDAEVVVRVVCGTWADELGAGLSGADATAVASLLRGARGDAERVAVDLARTAYRAGRERAARPAN